MPLDHEDDLPTTAADRRALRIYCLEAALRIEGPKAGTNQVIEAAMAIEDYVADVPPPSEAEQPRRRLDA